MDNFDPDADILRMQSLKSARETAEEMRRNFSY